MKKRPGRKARTSPQAAVRTKKRGASGQAGPSIESLARRIVRMAQLPSIGAAQLRAVYNENCTSEKATGMVAVGYAGLEQKRERWEQMRAGECLKARNVWTGRDTICIEWDREVELREGRTVKLREIAVHEIRNGKIQHERFFYNPMAFAPGQPAASGRMPSSA